MQSFFRVGSVAFALLALASCATTDAASDLRSDSSRVLWAEEIRAAEPSIGTALEAVERLRPSFLTKRTRDDVQVTVSGVGSGGLELLRDIPAHAVSSIRYFRRQGAGGRITVATTSS